MTQISEQRREQIVQTAKRIVDQHGPSRLTAEAITQEVGVSRPLLYHYFQNMGDLLDAVTGVYVGAFEDALVAWERDWGSFDPADGPAWALSLARTLRPELVDACPLLRGEQGGAAEGAYGLFLNRCADAMADRALAEGASPAYGPCRDAAQPRAAVRFALCGFAGALRGFPELADEDAAHMLEALWSVGAPAASAAGTAAPEEPELEEEPPAPPAPEGGTPSGKRGILGWIFN